MEAVGYQAVGALRTDIVEGRKLPPAFLSPEMEFVWLCGHAQMECRTLRKYRREDEEKIVGWLYWQLMTRFLKIPETVVPWIDEILGTIWRQQEEDKKVMSEGLAREIAKEVVWADIPKRRPAKGLWLS